MLTGGEQEDVGGAASAPRECGCFPERYELVAASAGTGKTHRLSSRLLRAILRRGVHADPAGVVATTFTRMAAGEILERVFRRLLEASRDEPRRDQLCRETGVPLTAQDCVRTAAALARRMDRVRIMTIDSLMGRMARASSLELEVAPGWRIASDSEVAEMHAGAIEAALSNQTPESTQSLLSAAARRPLARQIHLALDRAVTDCHATFASAGRDRALWETIGPLGDPPDPAALERSLGEIEAMEAPQTASAKPDQRFLKAMRAVVNSCRTDDWESLVSSGLGAATLGDGSYYGKPIPEPLAAAVRVLVSHASWHLLAQVQRRNRATAALLALYDALLWDSRLASQELAFEDVPRLLGEADVAGRLEELWYRLDSGIEELLIDEAQDTSLVQFRLLRPILDEMLAGGDGERGVLIVGDVKQSLYAWRQAEAELLPAIGQTWQVLTRCGLTESQRSGQVVLDAVNDVFSAVGSSVAISTREGARDAAERFSAQYAPHRTADRVGGADSPGLVRLMTHPVDSDEAPDRITGTVAAASSLLAEAAAAGVRCEVGVLVRANAPIRPLVAALQRAGIDASEEGGASLADDPAVSAVLSLLHLADHPTDELARFHVATSPISGAIGWIGAPSPAVARRDAGRVRRMLASRGYGATLERLVERVARRVRPAFLERLDQLVDLGREFDDQGSLRPSEFVRLVCTRRVERARRATVRVMTVHAAKGLEFDAVVLPDLDRNWAPTGRGAMLWRPRGVLDAAAGASLVVSKEIARLDHRLSEMLRGRESRQIYEELCTLYVAMTRARRALVMLIDPFKERKKSDPPPTRASSVLRCALVPEASAASAGALLLERHHARRAWHEGLTTTHAEPPTPAAAPAEVELRLALPRPDSLRRAMVVAPSSREGGGTVEIARRFDIAESGGIEIGLVAHAMLASIGWLEDRPPTEASLLQAGTLPGVEDHQLKTALAIVTRAMAGTAGDCLRRAWHAPRAGTSQDLEPLDLRREWRFLHDDTHEGQSRLISGVIDRLVLIRQGGRVIAADIIDYKTDRLEAADESAIGQRVEHYAPQLRAYAAAVARMFRIPPDQVRAALVFLSADHVVFIP